MAPVPPHPFRNALPVGFGEKPGVVIGRFGHFPHVVQLVHHQEAHPVAQVQQLPGRGVVGCADGVDAHVLHDPELPFRRLLIKGRAQGPQVVMQAHAVELHGLAVQEKALFRVEPCLPETHVHFLRLLPQGEAQAVQGGGFHAPGGHACRRQRDLGGSAVRCHASFRDHSAVRVKQRRVGRFSPFVHFRAHMQQPSVPVPLGVHRKAAGQHVPPGQGKQMHVPVDPRPGIPAGIGALVPHVDGDFVVPRLKEARQVHQEGGVAVTVGADHLSVQKHVRIHVHAVKIQVYGALRHRLIRAQGIRVPSVPGGIQILRLADEPVVGQRHVPLCPPAEIAISAVQGQQAEPPPRIHPCPHGAAPSKVVRNLAHFSFFAAAFSFPAVCRIRIYFCRIRRFLRFFLFMLYWNVEKNPPVHRVYR